MSKKILSTRVLNKENINEFISSYETEFQKIKLPAFDKLPTVEVLKQLKRGKISFPAYLDDDGKEREISIFELANRVFSDLVIIHGVKKIFTDKIFPYEEYHILLGTENSTHDNDITCKTNRKKYLIGEAFNTANSFFKLKLYKTVVKLENEKKIKNKIVLFNSDNGNNALSENYLKMHNSIRFIAVEVPMIDRVEV